MTQEDKLRHERDEALTALAIAQRGLSEAQRAYAAARKKYQTTLRTLVEYVEYRDRERHAPRPAAKPRRKEKRSGPLVRQCDFVLLCDKASIGVYQRLIANEILADP
jgi:hypothetical protein